MRNIGASMLKSLIRKSRPSLPFGARVYAIGDVHGRLDLLDCLLERLRIDNVNRSKANVTLVFLGDLIDRGPNSRGVVARARAGVSWANTVCLMGNHEEMMLDVLDGRSGKLELWLRHGGIETLISWGVPREAISLGTLSEVRLSALKVIDPSDRSWLCTLRTSHRIGDYYFVHAGIRPGIALERQEDVDRLWIRDEFLGSRRDHGAMIIHGHSISDEIDKQQNRIGIDTGAYRTGRLSAIGLSMSDQWFITN